MELVIIIALVRLLVPFTILRWPFYGFIASMVADGLDFIIFDLAHVEFPQYQGFDKLLDLYMLAFAMIVSLRWQKLPKVIALLLFGVRLVGVALFSVTKIHLMLFFFPNLFEFFFFFETARQKFLKVKFYAKKYVMILFVLLAAKLVQEYILHVAGLNPWAIFRALANF